jgi:hypothetical protein
MGAAMGATRLTADGLIEVKKNKNMIKEEFDAINEWNEKYDRYGNEKEIYLLMI